jgi:hypothetical protein
MNISVGQGLLLKLPFADGAPCNSKRTFLVIDVDYSLQKISLLNISSSRGKEHKLLFDSNKKINNYKPPFLMPSFVKLDALYQIDYFTELESRILHNGDKLNTIDLTSIIDKFAAYRIEQTLLSANYSIEDVKTQNAL